MFSLTNVLCKIVSCTNVSEKHGNERVAAISIGLYVVQGGEVLEMFDASLRNALYRKPQPKPGELPMEHDGLTELRYPHMRNLAWDRKYEGYLLRFHIGATGMEDVLLAECGLKDIRFTTQEGGSVGVHFKITAHPKDEVDHGKIATRLQQEIGITLTPPDDYVDPGLFGAPASDADDEHRPFAGSDLDQPEELEEE
ncbi:hypothetical protein [Burkholderia cenocepacia]|uniref:hypothetical protein n=1 Tax=Burkholderia cenocepacia TaxID=95486 RepID=UPI002018671A|nr:hypothetical protein [Burkholderia cenocepacia]MCO1396382.1 hypothetical protein [Burkholderia cenocepacia]MCO1408956.1 hypothetical protein [Burkholderia cenocepacia]UQN92069.1 hypothetical protein L0Z06_15215 [Burkholderia cenocepacia]UQN99218.1 hypothetical protein L0Z39_17005 [Burkholderia cenocepacia]UQP50827.1 hypothetical protein L0Y99_10240 [Burkholderia cenocepacia]